MIEWEYEIVRIHDDADWTIEAKLNHLGHRGWEGWAVLDEPRLILLKRQRQHEAVRAESALGGNVAGQITVDTTNETVAIEFIDDKGDTNADAPAGAVVTFTSDNPAVATVAADPTNLLQGDITPVAEGTANIGATIADSSGNPIMEPDGTTPFSVQPVQVTVSAGSAQSAALVLSV